MAKPKEIVEIEEILGVTIGEDEYKIENGLLVTLSLYLCLINDVTFLSKYIHLRQIILLGSDILDFSPLRSLKKLRVLSLPFNNITSISPLFQFESLKLIELNNNRITNIDCIKENKLPASILYLGLADNQIKNVPFEFFHHFKSRRGSELVTMLSGNPIENISFSVIEQGYEAIKNHFEALEKQQANLKEVKVMFLGDGSAGKTTLMKRLLGDMVSAKEPETDGIVIEKGVLDDIKVNYWDFGGQEIQHNTHQFFLTENSIYVLVLDNRREEEPEYWLEYIKSLGAESPVIVVSNKIDDEQHSIEKFDPSYLKEKYPFIQGFHKVSALHGINTDYLQQSLNQLIRNSLFPDFGESWLQIKEFVENETILEKNYITSETYLAFCKEITNESSAKSILQWLRSIGKVSYYHKNLATKHFYILNPEWLTYAVYKIILSEQTIQKNGALHINDFEQILKVLPNSNLKKHYEYRPSDNVFLLEMMKEYDLCYTTDNQHIIIPSAIKISYQTDFKIEKTTLAFFFEYLDFLPPAIFSRLLVKLYPKKKGDAVWRTGIELFDEDTQSHALLRADKAEQRIYVYVNGERRIEFFQQIRSQIVELNRLFPKMRWEQRIPLKSKFLEDQSVDYEELINSMLDNRPDYYHGKTREFFSVAALLAQIEPKEITQKNKELTGNVFINNAPNFYNNPTFTNIFQSNATAQNQIEELKDFLMDLEEWKEKDENWKKALVEALGEDALRKALDEFNRLEEANDKVEQKTSKDYLNRLFKKLKDVKDLTAIGFLPAEVATKLPKMLALWEKLTELLK